MVAFVICAIIAFGLYKTYRSIKDAKIYLGDEDDHGFI